MMMIALASDVAAIGIGAVGGAWFRFQLGRMAADKIAQDPMRWGTYSGWHTAGINMVGSFLLGGISQTPVSSFPTTTTTTTAAAAAASGLMMTPRTKLMLGVGFCGSFTTFSTFSVDVANWLAKGEIMVAMKYVMANNVGSVMAAAAGMALVKRRFG
jgi:CrcB protein